MSLNLKHIPCPAGNKCTAFQCIFGHNGRESNDISSLSLKESELKQPSKEDAIPSISQDYPRKRARLSEGGALLSPYTNPETKSHDQARRLVSPENEGLGELASEGVRLHSATRRVSPPPIRSQKFNTTPNVSLVSRSAGSALSGTKSAERVSSDKPDDPKPLVEKRESLNPRLLKHAPASHDVRMKLVRMLHQEFQRMNRELKRDGDEKEQALVLSDQALITRALDEECEIARSKPSIYPNVMKNRVMQHKRMSVAQWKEQRQKEHDALHKKGRGLIGDEKPIIVKTGLQPAQEVKLLERILTPIHDLSNHGYIVEAPAEEAVNKAKLGLEAAMGWEQCDRCQQRFQVFPGRREDGSLTSGGQCKFHWGKPYVGIKTMGDKTRQPKRYACCSQDVGDSIGCSTENYHVFKAGDAKRLATLLQFKETPPNPVIPDERAVCFDCEMSYTVYGLELIRLTVTSWPWGGELLDVLVRPMGEILDLNSRYSGVWPDDMAKAEPWSADDTAHLARSEKMELIHDPDQVQEERKRGLKIVSSPKAARELFFSIISPSTPLIGHGLENDLNAMRMIHSTIIDTALLYPHRAGLPFRNGLKYLMSTHLNRKIQQETGPETRGHDSAEDARAAGDLVKLKISKVWKEMQLMGWTTKDGICIPPNMPSYASDGKGGVVNMRVDKTK